MKYLTLNLIKNHLQLNSDYTAEDTYLTMLGGVVEEAVAMHIDDDFDTLAEDNNNQLPLPLIQACLLLLGTYYSNRENIAYANPVEIPMSYSYLCSLYKNYSSTDMRDTQALLREISTKVNALTEYMNYDKNRVIHGDGVNVTTSGQTTTIKLDTIDEGTY